MEAVLANANEADAWAFTGLKGDVVGITMESSQMDPYVTLLAPNGDRIAYNDDSPDGSGGSASSDAELAAFLLEDGVYTILAGGYKPGAYQLSVSYETNAVVDEIKAMYGGGSLLYGAVAQGWFLTAEAHNWTFKGVAGHLVTIEIETGGTKCHLTLLDPNENEVAAIDNGTGPYARLEAYKLPQSGNYTLHIENLDGLQGGYALYLKVILGELGYGDEVAAQLSADVEKDQSEIHRWRFTGRQGDIVAIAVESDAVVSHVWLMTPEDEGLALKYDDGGEIILESILLEDGVYTIEIHGQKAGDYQLILALNDIADIDEAAAERDGEFIEMIDTRSVDYGFFVRPEEAHIWTFEGIIGQTVIIAMDSDHGGKVTLFDPNRDEVARHSSYSGGVPARIEVDLKKSGIYAIHVESPYHLQVGYTLSLEANFWQ